MQAYYGHIFLASVVRFQNLLNAGDVSLKIWRQLLKTFDSILTFT
jgi:hypothetical protein